MIDILKSPKYICYLSFSKVDNLYSQLSDYECDRIQTTKTTKIKKDVGIKGGPIISLINAELSYGKNNQQEETREGRLNHIQRLSRIIDYYNQNGQIGNLRRSIKNGGIDRFSALYYLRSEFICEQDYGELSELAKCEQTEADQYKLYKEKLLTKSRMAIIVTQVREFRIELACSMKYFSDMGTYRIKTGDAFSDNDLLEITPHSGNRFFFDGRAKATFQSLIILTGQDKNVLYGSPLVLINDFNPNLTI